MSVVQYRKNGIIHHINMSTVKHTVTIILSVFKKETNQILSHCLFAAFIIERFDKSV